VVPVPAQVGRPEGDDDEVPRAGLDPLVAARAEVALHRLVGLDPPDLDVYLGIRAHRRSAAVTARAAATST
jgi:hypothetical protein